MAITRVICKTQVRDLDFFLLVRGTVVTCLLSRHGYGLIHFLASPDELHEDYRGEIAAVDYCLFSGDELGSRDGASV